MFRRSKNPQAIKGDVIGEALVEVRDQIGDHGWRKGGAFHGETRPMCLGNAIGAVVQRSEGEKNLFWGWVHQQAPWLQIPYFRLGLDMVKALGFQSPEHLTSWNDSLHFGQSKVLKLVNKAIENRNRIVISHAHDAALAENAEREKLYVPSEWKPRTVSGEQREKVTV